MFLTAIVLSILAASTQAEIAASPYQPMNTFHATQALPQSETPQNDFENGNRRQGNIDSYGAPIAPVEGQSSPTYTSYEQAAPWQEVYPGRVPQYAPGFSANLVANPGGFGPWLNTAMQVALGLLGFSLLISLITKVAGASFLADIFEGRSFDTDSIPVYTELVMNGIEKAKNMYENLDKIK